MNNKLARYPAVYSRILLNTPADGSPLEITLASEAAAARERLQFYNFLKFVRRNPHECAHLHAGNRANNLTISLQGCTLSFRLRGGKTATELEQGYIAATGEDASEIKLPLVPDDSRDMDLHIPELNSPVPNPLDLLNNFNKEK